MIRVLRCIQILCLAPVVALMMMACDSGASGLPDQSDGDVAESETGQVDGDAETEETMESEEAVEQETDPEPEAVENNDEPAGWFPVQEACPIPEPKLSRWTLDFPRMQNSGSYEFTDTVATDNGFMTYFSGNGKITILPEGGAPITYFPENLPMNINAVITRGGEWYSLDGSGMIWKFQARENTWQQIIGYGYGDYLRPDPVEGVWLMELFSASTPVWINGAGTPREFRIAEPYEDYVVSIVTRPFLMSGGRKYVAGRIMTPDEPPGTGFIARVDEDAGILKVIYTVPESEYYKPIIDIYSDPVTGKIVATGYHLYLEGILGADDTVTVTGYSEEPGPYGSWMDRETGILYETASPDFYHGEVTLSMFSRRYPDGTREDLQPHDIERGYDTWWYRVMRGPDLNHLFVTGVDQSYRYLPDEERWGPVYTNMLSAGIHPGARMRGMSVGGGGQKNFRVVAWGHDMPTLTKTGCRRWQTQFNGYGETMDVFDNNDTLLAVGAHGKVLQVLSDGSVGEIPAPTPSWAVGRSIIATSQDELYVVGWKGVDGDQGRIYYRSPQGEWFEFDATTIHDIYKPFKVLLLHDVPYAITARTSGFDVGYKVYTLQGYSATELMTIPDMGFFRVHDGELYLMATNKGVYHIDPASQSITEVVEAIPNGEDRYVEINDAVRTAEGHWLLAGGVFAPAPLMDYNPASGEYTYIYAFHGNTLYSGRPSSYPWDDFDAYGEITVLAKLPTGEILAGGKGGNILIRSAE